MSDVADTWNTGPASKGTHSGGKTFKPKLSGKQGSMPTFTNSSDGARRAFNKMKFSSEGGFGKDVKGALKKKPGKKQEGGNKGGNFRSTK